MNDDYSEGFEDYDGHEEASDADDFADDEPIAALTNQVYTPDRDPCDICNDPQDCECENEWSDECYRCGGFGFYVREHCCACGGSPYCQCCRKCGSGYVGHCKCPMPVERADGTVSYV